MGPAFHPEIMLHHFPHQAIDGSWHCVYRTPGCGSLTSMGRGPTKQMAQDMADKLNAEQERNQRAAEAAAIPPSERPLAPGFYTDKDAA